MPQTIVGVGPSSGLVVLLGAVAFVFPVLAWRAYAANVASSGGLYSFVEAAAGVRVARLHGAVWVVSYFLYLPSTVVFVVYDLLPTAFPGIAAYRAALDVGIPVAMVAGLLVWRLGLFSLTAVVAAAQVVLVGILAGMEVAHAGTSATTFALHVPASAAARSVGSVSLFFVCGSLPLYMGTEVRDPRRVTARSLALAIGVGGACALAGALALGRFPVSVLNAEVPGWLIGRDVGGTAMGDVVVIGTALSVLTLVLLEFVALTRLLHAMAGVRRQPAEVAVGLLFIGSAALSLLNPDAAYERLLNPSLIALYLSELVVFAVYPRFRQRQGRLRATDVAVAVAASALMLYGLYNALKPSTGL